MQKIKIQLAPGLWLAKNGTTPDSNLAAVLNIREAQKKLKMERLKKPYPQARYSGELNWTP